MIPYIIIPPLELGGLITFQPFGTLVVIGSLVGYAVGCWHAVSVGLDRREMRTLILWVLVLSFVFAHWVSMLLYYPDVVWRRPLILVSFHLSLSSYGGFLGAALGVALYWACYRHKTRLSPWKVGDAIAVGWTAGWFFGRLGCTIAHCIVGAQVVFWTFTYPANQATNNWTLLPENWQHLRTQWEYSHAAGAVLNFTAFITLILSVLVQDE